MKLFMMFPTKGSPCYTFHYKEPIMNETIQKKWYLSQGHFHTERLLTADNRSVTHKTAVLFT